MVFIYTLKLTQGKYYVGKTTNPAFRMDNHFNSNGSAWTMKYKPIEVIELIPNCDDYDEDKYTRKYMDKYGIENVRGGSFVSIELDKSTIQHLTQMSNGTNDKCFVCSKSGHFAKDCKEKDSYDVWCCEKRNHEYERVRCKSPGGPGTPGETWFTNTKESEKHEKGLRRKSPGGPGTPGETWF